MKVLELTKENLQRYEQVSIKFRGVSVYELKDEGLKLEFIETPHTPFTKDFDNHGKPSELVSKFYIKNWKMIVIEKDDKWIGGAILAFQTEGINMLEGRDDIVVVWDVRIDPEFRCMGYGSKLFDHIKEWAKENNCKRIKVESQNNNVAACNFYMAQGARLGSFNRFAYDELPDEIQFLWNIEVS